MPSLSTAARDPSPAPAWPLTTAVLCDWATVRALAPEWNALLRASDADSVFLTWEWVGAWLDVVGEQTRPLVVVARDPAGGLVGLAPFYLTRLRLAHLLTYRALRVVGDELTGAEYPDWIVRRQGAPDITDALARALAGVAREWDCLWMPRLAGWTGAADRLRRAAAVAGLHLHERARVFSAAALPRSRDEYLKQLSAKTRKNVTRDSARIMGAGARLVSCASSRDLPRFLDALFRLHHERWRLKGEEGTFRRKPAVARFYARFAPLALAAGWLRVFALEKDGELKAVQYGYVYGGAFHALQEGFDPEEPGLGNVLRLRVLEACLAEGLQTYDFLAGHTPHKERWNAHPRHGYDFFLGARRPRTALLFRRAVWPSGRFLRPLDLA